VPAPSRITYRQSRDADGAAAVPATARTAVKTATDWLTAHHLVPAGVSLARAHTTYNASTRTIAFRLEPPRGLVPADTPAASSIALDATGNVVMADVTWPSLDSGQTMPLFEPRHALAAGGGIGAFSAPAGSTVIVDAVSLAYRGAHQGKTLIWQPVYRFEGHVDTPGGQSLHVVRVMPAVANAK
jgi:hypothetical protein